MSEMIKIPDGWHQLSIDALWEECWSGEWGNEPSTYNVINVLGTNNINDDGTISLDYYTLRTIPTNKLETRLLRKKDILFEKSGGSTNKFAGRVALVKNEITNFSCSNFMQIARVNKEFESEFIFYKLYNAYKTGLVAKYQQQTTGIINFKINEYFEEILSLPKSKIEQQKIAEVLSEVDNAILKTEELFEKNKRLKTALMQDLLSYGIDENGKNRNPQTHKFKPSELGDIPVEWDVRNIGEIYKELKTGSTPSRSNPEYFRGEILWVTSGELKYKTITNTIEKITEQAVKDTNLKVYPPGTFFIAITGLEAEGTRGSCAVIGKEATTNQSCMAFEANKEIDTSYLFQYYLLHGKYISLYYSQGSKQQSLNNKIVAQIPIHVPPLPEQQKIAQILSSQDEKIEDIKNKLNKLKSLKASLMQDLLSGKVRVTNLMEENS